jgi:hypothetical protein
MATRRNSGEEIRVPGGLRTARDKDPLEEAAAARSWDVGKMRGNNPNSPRPQRCSRQPYPRCPGGETGCPGWSKSFLLKVGETPLVPVLTPHLTTPLDILATGA